MIYNLPKPHLSWSQIRLWKKSPREYAKRYFEDSEFFKTKEMAYGSFIGESIENVDFLNLNEAEINAVTYIPKCDEYEKSINLVVDNINIFGYIDGYIEESNAIQEYKTGKSTWTQERVNNHGQLVIYAMGIYEQTGEIPECFLYWMPTSNNEKSAHGVELTGETYEFKRTITIEDIDEMRDTIVIVANQISNAYTAYLLGQEEEETNVLIKEYEALQLQAKPILERLDELKNEIKKDFDETGVDRYESNNGTFYYTTRKKYKYPEHFKVKEQELKDLKKQLEKSLDYTETRSFAYRALKK